MLRCSVLAFVTLLLGSTLAETASSSTSPVSSISSSASQSVSTASGASPVSNAPAATSPTTPSTPNPGSGEYTYAGCYNETTNIAGSGGVRALAGGSMESELNMTPQMCIQYCATITTAPYTYAGLEYGRECWCGTYLNPLSAKLPDSACNMDCLGDPSSSCGGSLILTLYNRTTMGKKSAAGPSGRTRLGSDEWRSMVIMGVLAAGFGGVVGWL